MRKWIPAAWQAGAPVADPAGALAAMVDHLGTPDFGAQVLAGLRPLLPAASWSVYRVGAGCEPRMFLSASLGVPDTTRACWQAYLSGPVRHDRSLRFDGARPVRAQLCHITAVEVPREHRARVYEAHGVAERLSVVEHVVDGALFAVNFYRHEHQRPLSDRQIAAFEQLAPALLALARKQVALGAPPAAAALSPVPPGVAGPAATEDDAGCPAPLTSPLDSLRALLQRQWPDLTGRELDVCARLLRGMTHDGIAADLAVSAATVKTYRNRAFQRLGIHFRSELFARVLGAG